MNVKEYQNKVRGCWLGKNIGGTLGAPFEGKRGVYDISFYTTDMSQGGLPNDDLDVQLVMLNAAERFGKRVNAEVMAEYWLTWVVADFSEYGAGKNNAAMGIYPSVSGYYNNHNRHSCGAFIRSELWACLMPGHPEIAVKYAYDDAAVDHFGEGLYSEVFCAALESAAFVENDVNRLLDIGLSYIPDDCGVANAVKVVRAAYAEGVDWKEARRRVLFAEPCSFGKVPENEPKSDLPDGEPGYDVPANIGITMIGLLYGAGDFEKSICIAAGCGEDADCTAATLGSILGIIQGAEALPEKWTKPIGDDIKTITLDLVKSIDIKKDSPESGTVIPKTVTELTERVCNLMPTFLGRYINVLGENGFEIHTCQGQELFCGKSSSIIFPFHKENSFLDRYYSYPTVVMENASLRAEVGAPDGINIKEGQETAVHFHFINLIRKQQWLTVKIYMPEEWECSVGREFVINLDQAHGGFGEEDATITITPRNICSGKTDVLFEISSNGRLSRLYFPFTFMNTPQEFRKI